jgi:cytochrome c biogenesis protein CcdA
MLEHNISIVTGIAEGFSLITGILFILLGIMELKRFAEARGMMGQQHSVAKPLLMMLCGSALVALPSILPAIVSVIFASSQDDNYNPTTPGLGGLVMFLKFLGLCSIIKGIIMLSKTGGNGAQPGMRGKSFIHIFAGVLLLHIITVQQLVQNFFFS